MNILQDYLIKILQSDQFLVNNTAIKSGSETIIKSGFGKDIENCYKSLGGLKSNYPLFHFKYEIVITKSIILLYDQLHFNRYRNITLQSSLYSKIPGYPKSNLQRYCRMHEKECLKSGMRSGLWTSGEAEDHFGQASASGDFFGNGAPGWKLQAFKDYLRDFSAFASGYKIIPVAVHDHLMVEGKLIKISSILTSRHSNHEEFLLRHIKRRMLSDKDN